MKARLDNEGLLISFRSRREIADLEEDWGLSGNISKDRRSLGTLILELMDNKGMNQTQVDNKEDPQGVRKVTIGCRIQRAIVEDGKDGVIEVPYDKKGNRIRFKVGY